MKTLLDSLPISESAWSGAASRGRRDEQLMRLAAPLLGAADVVFFGTTVDCVPRLLISGPGVQAADEELLRGLCLAALESRAPLVIPDVAGDERLAWRRHGALGRVGSFLGTALRDSLGRARGVLGVIEPHPRGWTSGETRMLSVLAQAVSSELHRAELAAENARLVRALARNDARHRKLLDSCPIPIFSVGMDGKILEANPAAAEVIGRSPEQLRGTLLEQLVAPEDLSFVVAAFAATAAGDPSTGVLECRVVRPSGERRTLALTRVAITDEGRVVGVQGIGGDITDERSREAHFRRAERMASVPHLLRGVCHELNNPLTSIKSFADLLLLDDRPEEEREALEIVAREAARAARIVTDLRVVARQRQEACAHRAQVNIASVVEQVVSQRHGLVESARVMIRLELDRTAPPVWAVADQIEQVLLHLLTNAVQALRDRQPPRLITIATFPGELGVVLQVSDTGPGIAPENLNRIFDPFWTTKSPGEGTGLGLSLVQSIVEDHGGRISVDSQIERGATFTLEFPATPRFPLPIEPGLSGQSARRSLRVLIADQEGPVRASLSRYLERRGHLVVQSARAFQSVGALGESTNSPPFDIIVADLHLLNSDGERFTAELRSRADGLEQCIVYLAGDPIEPELEQLLLASGATVIGKPFELAEVAQIVEAQAGMFGS